MKKNMGTADRLTRIAAAMVMAILYLTQTISGTLGLGLLAVAIILLVSSFLRFCPVYLIFGIKTCKN